MENKNSSTDRAPSFFTLLYKIILAYLEIIVSPLSHPKPKNLKGKNVLITGSGHGLGREIALKFSKAGANLVLVDINKENNDRVKEEITNAQGGKVQVFTHSTDIRDEANVAKLAKKVQNELGDIDVLINNAGIVQCQPFMELSPDMVEKTFQVNTLAHIWTIKHFLPGMMKKKQGNIVAVASVAGMIGGKYLTDYCASKFAVVGLMDSLDKEIHDAGANPDIRLTTVCPCSISTGMFETFTSRFNWLLPILKPSDVAESVIEAVRRDQTFVVLPKIFYFFYYLSTVIPQKVATLIQEYLDYGVKPHVK